MPPDLIKDLAKIIERDSKFATYKFALLRGTIEIIQEQDHYKSIDLETMISYPMGLLILKWIEYYYPILSNNTFIPQKHGDTRERTIAFRSEFEKVIAMYPTTQTSDQLFYDLKKGIKDPDRIKCITALLKKCKLTIVNQPMHYIGSAIGRGNQLYKYHQDSKRYRHINILNLQWIIDHMGTFSIPVDLHHTMQVVGSFLTGTHSLIFRWAEFTSNLTNDPRISTSNMITLLKSEFNERDILQAKNYYSDILDEGVLYCTWSGKPIKKDLHIDHMIPFVALRNNDLWNLIPSKGVINIRKSDKMPSLAILNNAAIKDRILHYWEDLWKFFPEQFETEVQVSLLGKTVFSKKSWKNDTYNQLASMCNYLIEERGFDPWTTI